MTDSDDVRILALPSSVAADRPPSTLADVRDTLEPDGVWVPGPARRPRAVARARQVFDDPVVHAPLGDGSGPVREHRVGPVTVVTVQRASALPEAATVVSTASAESRPIVLVCDDVRAAVEPTALETRLEPAERLVDAIPRETTAITLVTGGQSAAYDRVWHLDRSSAEPIAVHPPDSEPIAGEAEESIDGERLDPAEDIRPPDRSTVSVRILGTAPVQRYAGAGTMSSITLGSGPESSAAAADDRPGRARRWPVRSVEVVDASSFGLEAVTGVGPKTAARLADRGIRTRSDLLATPVGELAAVQGLGRSSARRMHDHARVLETGEPLVTSSDSLPGADWDVPPLCFDIETDGLSPTIIWQLGVYDPVTDDYRAFVEKRDPTDPGRVVEAFLDWLLAVHPNRALLTWNGWRFDYRHVGSFVNRHVAHYADEWESITKLDLYLWAVTDGNALLPGRTNKLDDVADALGYDDGGTGLDGAATAAAYQRFVRTGDPLEWDRHERYCEDDCRALWHVYERLSEVPPESERSSATRDARTTPGSSDTTSRSAGGGDGSKPTGQTGLGDF